MSTVGQISNGESGLSARTKLNLVIDRTTVFDTSANFTSNNPTLNTGQIGVETDDLLTVPKFKIGDGANDWNTLPYFSSSSTPSLQNVTDVGSTTTNAIDANGFNSKDVFNVINSYIDPTGIYVFNSSFSGSNLLEVDRVNDVIKYLGVQVATLNDIPSLTGYEQTSNKSSSYTTSSTTTYANTKALVDGLSTKPDKAASNIFMYRNFK